MSMDRSLKPKSSLVRHRNVLSRTERLKILADQERRKEGDSPYGLPKVAHRKAPIGGKAKKKTEQAGAEGGAEAPKK